jgi:hypothetical protein
VLVDPVGHLWKENSIVFLKFQLRIGDIGESR